VPLIGTFPDASFQGLDFPRDDRTLGTLKAGWNNGSSRICSESCDLFAPRIQGSSSLTRLWSSSRAEPHDSMRLLLLRQAHPTRGGPQVPQHGRAPYQSVQESQNLILVALYCPCKQCACRAAWRSHTGAATHIIRRRRLSRIDEQSPHALFCEAKGASWRLK
jgi:hypothetical protein